ncbi:MAG: Trk system potassium transporter TrkA [Planctomycetota bacterium]|nr:MAG: Trk system potassium transporter TrkA [Planctomycetota bacterium]
MNIIIAGAGEVGRHLATVLTADNHEITLIDLKASNLESLREQSDVATLVGSATHADILQEAGADRANLFVAATDSDEINLLAASVAKSLGTTKVIARVHHSVYQAGRGINYAKILNIDQLVCPEYLTSLAIASVLRDPAVQAIQYFARGQIVMERIEVSHQSQVIGKTLESLSLPAGVRIGTVTQQDKTVVPTGETILDAGDHITLIGATEIFHKVLPMFRKGELYKRKIVIMGGSAVSVWLSRALDSRFFSIRLYLTDHTRALELSQKLTHVTVIEDDPTDPNTFAEENIADADAFVASTWEDEDNILGALQAKHLGVPRTFAVIIRPTYHELIEELGIDRIFSPRIVACQEILHMTQGKAVQKIAQLDEQGTCVYRINVGRDAEAIGQTLINMKLPKGCVFVAIQRGDNIHVPGPHDLLEVGDTVVAMAHENLVQKLGRLFS